MRGLKFEGKVYPSPTQTPRFTPVLPILTSLDICLEQIKAYQTMRVKKGKKYYLILDTMHQGDIEVRMWG